MLYWLCCLVAQILLCKLYVLYTEKTTLSSYFILVDFALIWPLLITWFSHSHFYCVIVPPPFSCFFHQWWAEWFYTNQNPFSPKEYPMFFVVVVCFHILWFLPFLHFVFCFPLHHFTLLYHVYLWNLKENFSVLNDWSVHVCCQYLKPPASDVTDWLTMTEFLACSLFV